MLLTVRDWSPYKQVSVGADELATHDPLEHHWNPENILKIPRFSNSLLKLEEAYHSRSTAGSF